MNDDEGTLAGLVSELENLLHDQTNSEDESKNSLSERSIWILQSLLDDGDGSKVWELLSARNVPPSALVGSLSATMESTNSRLALLASRAYLSILVSGSGSGSLHTLLNPLTFFALFSSLRRSVRPQQQQHPEHVPSSQMQNFQDLPSRSKNRPNNGKKKKGRGRKCEELEHDYGEGQTDLGDLLVQVLQLVESVLSSSVRLDRIPCGMKSLVETVVVVLESGMGQLSRVSDVCFRILHGVVSRTEHGDQTETSVQVMRSLSATMLSHTKSNLRTSIVEFMVVTIVPMGKENEKVRNAVVYLPRYLAVNAPGKSEPRACAVESIVEIIRVMQSEDQVGFVSYVIKMCRGKDPLRLLGVDLILALLTSLSEALPVEDSQDGEGYEVGNTWGMKCLDVLVERCSDIAAGIRARALTNTHHAIEFLEKDSRNLLWLQKLMSESSFNDTLRMMCMDVKAAVRKAALVLAAKSTMLRGGPIDKDVLKIMGCACSDPLVSIRKAALTALSETFRKFLDSKVIMEWLNAVPRLIMDNETSIQEECENLFLELVLDWISRVGNHQSHEYVEAAFSDAFLFLMEKLSDGDIALYVKKICTSLGKKKRLKTSFASSLQNIISASETMWLSRGMAIENWTAPPGSWMLLFELSSFMPKVISWKFLHHHWELLDKGNMADIHAGVNEIEQISTTWATDRVHLLQIISNVSMELPPEPAADLAHNLLKRIEYFNMHLTEVDAHVKALRTLCKRKAMKPEEGDNLISKWVRQLLTKAQGILDSYLSKISESDGFRSPTTFQAKKMNEKKMTMKSELMSQAVNAVFTIGCLVLVCPTADYKSIIPLLHTIMTSKTSEGKPKKLAGLIASREEIAPSLYIQSWVTMGKICLVDGKIAKRYIPLFVQELEKSDSAAVRNGTLLAMVDFCVRHTALVDCYIPRIANLLRDSCELVRRQTFILLSRLLQRDYVKWRGVLFLRFLLPLVDESEKIRHLADFLFGNILKVKAPLLAYNSFVEAIFVLNDCHAHSGHSASSKTESQLFSLRGSDEASRKKRMHIYVSLLKQMAPEQLLATSAKLCAEILAAASDGLLSLDDVTAQCVLQDSLEILACKEIRIQTPRASDTLDMEEETGEGSALLVARGRAVTHVSKKNLIQHAVPIFIELKRLLESKNSPLTGCLMDCLCVLLKDYKNEIEDILVADKQLQKELMYDMQKYEAAKAKSIVTEAVKTSRRADPFRSPINRGNSDDVFAEVSVKLGMDKTITSAVKDAAARATARSVLKELNRNMPTPLHNVSIPKVRTSAGGNGTRTSRPMNVLMSVSKRQTFDFDDEAL